MAITVGLPSAALDCAMSGAQDGEHDVLTGPWQRLIFPREAQGPLALLPRPAFRRGLSHFWGPVLLGTSCRLREGLCYSFALPVLLRPVVFPKWRRNLPRFSIQH